MPELPEVETTCRGIRPHICGHKLDRLVIREYRLRWVIDKKLPDILSRQTLRAVERRAKYILLRFDTGTLAIHLGMSGSLRVLSKRPPPDKHDHFDLLFANGVLLRYHDPRRFGALVWIEGELDKHKLFDHLGPEPLSSGFNGEYLFQQSCKRKVAIKQHIMNASIVVGVGNIYANEALFSAAVLPTREAGKVSRAGCERLVIEIKGVLERAIIQGGTTLKDFQSPEGRPGYFVQKLQVYGKKGEPCPVCARSLKEIRINNRSTVFCSKCQK
jgi:formamidopyrimidine-DNA glycosylase